MPSPYRASRFRIKRSTIRAADANAIVRANHEHWRFRLEFLQGLGALFAAFIVVDPYDRRRLVFVAFDAHASLDGLPFARLTSPFGDGIIPGDDIDQHGIPANHLLVLTLRLPHYVLLDILRSIS